MRKIIYLSCVLTGLTVSTESHANWFKDIVDQIVKTNEINTQILGGQNEMVRAQREMLSSQKDIESLMRIVNTSLVGNSGWGTYNFHDYQSYGQNANSWTSVMQMAGSSGGSGALGQTMRGVANQFSIDENSYNRGIKNPTSQKYYVMQSQTILATRAASQLDYDKVQDQIAYQQMLQQQIEKTKDLKGAVDLNNRIQVEANLIYLEMLRQMALSNQQQSMSAQSNMNTALMNARFLAR